jgi:hypothetical protein
MREGKQREGPDEEWETQMNRLLQMFENCLHEGALTEAALSIEDPTLIGRLKDAHRDGKIDDAIFSAWTTHPLLAKALDAQLTEHPEARYAGKNFPREEVYQRVIDLMTHYSADATGFPREERITRIDPYTRVRFLNYLIQKEVCKPREAAEALYDEFVFNKLEDRHVFE